MEYFGNIIKKYFCAHFHVSSTIIGITFVLIHLVFTTMLCNSYYHCNPYFEVQRNEVTFPDHIPCLWENKFKPTNSAHRVHVPVTQEMDFNYVIPSDFILHQLMSDFVNLIKHSCGHFIQNSKYFLYHWRQPDFQCGA